MDESSIEDFNKLVTSFYDQTLNEESIDYMSNISEFATVPNDKFNDTAVSKGRSPWYDKRGNHKEAYVVGLCGGSASGKTTVAQNIQSRIKTPWVVILSMDSFYKVLSHEDHIRANNQQYDFDHPDAIDFELARKTILRIKSGKKTFVPIYDFTTHSRLENQYNVVYGADILIIDGILLFCFKELLEVSIVENQLLDLKIFVNTDADLRLCRRIKRDIEERGRDLESVFTQYIRFVKPNFDKYISPFEKKADIVIPWNSYNLSAINLIESAIKRNLENRRLDYRSEIIKNNLIEDGFTDFVHVIKETSSTKLLHHILRDSNADRTIYCEASSRLIELVLIEALSLQNKEGKTIEKFEENVSKYNKQICLVYIIRVGEEFKYTINDMSNYTQGQILIQHSEKSGEPELYSLDLPIDINNRSIFLFDATIATGSAAIMALRVLLDHDVNLENILLTTLIVSPIGINSILSLFPNIKIVTSAIEGEITQNYTSDSQCEDLKT